MATLEIGYSSSHCADCRINFKNASAAPNEAGHYTVLGYGPENGTAGCQQKWDKIVLVYPSFYETKEQVVTRLKEWYPSLRNVPFEGWQVIEAFHEKNEETERNEDLPQL